MGKVACSADGAGYLLDAGVVECVSESESIAKASQTVAQAATPDPFGATRNEVSALVEDESHVLLYFRNDEKRCSDVVLD